MGPVQILSNMEREAGVEQRLMRTIQSNPEYLRYVHAVS